jgi:uncharacterized membrane protein YeaQ/YmgE (transglycosylase-associated protein family)
VPSLKGSQPFSLSAYDWLKIGKGALLAATGAVGAYFTASVLPTLKEHVANDYGILIVTVVGAVVPVTLNLVVKYLTDTTTVVKILLLAATLPLCFAGTAMAADFVLIFDAARPQTYIVSADGTGNVTIRVGTDPAPQPPRPPTPPLPPVPPAPVPPVPLLTARALAVKGAADKVTGDPGRSETAQGIAALYRELARQSRGGQIKDFDSLLSGTKMATDMYLDTRGTDVWKGWTPVREVIGTYWTELWRNNSQLADYSKLLDEAADGLDASAPAKSITPEMLKLILQIVQIILSLLK